MRVEPELDPANLLMRYDLTLLRDVPNYAFYWLAAGLLLIPPVINSWRSASFEAARWRESDYGAAFSKLSSGGADD
jgi:hypothetical protein